MTIRNARPDEYAPLLAYLNAAYGFELVSFEKWFPNDWAQETTDWDHTYVAEEDGQVVSLVRTFPMDLVQNGARLRTAGIGSVSTAHQARGRGHMTALMLHAIDRMGTEGFHLSVLWGDRHRYGAFGYEPAGRTLRLEIGLRGLRRLGIEAVTPTERTADPESLAPVVAAYEASPYHRVRRPEEHPRLYGGGGRRVLTHGTGAAFGYVVTEGAGEKVHVEEHDGCPDAVLGILRAVLEERGGGGRLTLSMPADLPVPPAYSAAASGAHVSPTGMVRIVDLDAVLSASGLAQYRSELQGLSPAAQVAALYPLVGSGPANLYVHSIDHI